MSRKQVKILECFNVEIKVEPELVTVKEEPEEHFVLFLPRPQRILTEVKFNSIDQSENKSSSQPTNKDLELKPKKFKCEICAKSFILRGSLTGHKKIHFRHKNNLECDICGYKTVYKGHIKVHIRTHTNVRPFKCTREGCDKAFKRQSTLKSHQSVHSIVYEHECPECSKAFKTKTNLVQHRKLMHSASEIKLHKCSECAKSFKEVKYLRQHEKKAHSECQVSCPTCGKLFKNIERLRNHLYMLHNLNRKLHQCDICGYSTSVKANMKNHLTRHFEQEKIKCSICNKAFASKNGLKYHMFSHQNIHLKCEICSKSFNNPDNLRDHQKFHAASVSKDFHCTKCDSKFKTRRELTSHQMWIHYEGEKLKCPKCPQISKNPISLKRHIRQIHNYIKGEFKCFYNGCKYISKRKDLLKRHITRSHETSQTSTL